MDKTGKDKFAPYMYIFYFQPGFTGTPCDSLIKKNRKRNPLCVGYRTSRQYSPGEREGPSIDL